MPLRFCSPDFLDIWIAGSNEIGAIPRSALDLLDEEDRRELSQRGIASAARDFLLGRLMLRLALSRRSGRDPSSWGFVADGLGRVELRDADLNLNFSISHAGEFVVVALSDQPIGVDIERHGFDPESVSCCLSRDELVRIRALPNERQEIAALWTLKEAYSKLHGFGMNRELSEITGDEIRRSTVATSLSLCGESRYALTVLSRRGWGKSPIAEVHFLRNGSLSLVGAVSSRQSWVPHVGVRPEFQ